MKDTRQSAPMSTNQRRCNATNEQHMLIFNNQCWPIKMEDTPWEIHADLHWLALIGEDRRVCFIHKPVAPLISDNYWRSACVFHFHNSFVFQTFIGEDRRVCFIHKPVAPLISDDFWRSACVFHFYNPFVLQAFIGEDRRVSSINWPPSLLISVDCWRSECNSIVENSSWLISVHR